MSARSLVKNAADPDQQKFAGRRVKSAEERRAAILQAQLATPEGREFVWMELERHGIDDLPQGPMEQVYQFLGRREAGMALKIELMTQYPARFLEMQAEAMARQARGDREVDAQHTPALEDK